MKKFFPALVTVLALSTPALAEEMGPMPVTALRGTGAGVNQCALFQVGGAAPWYAIVPGQVGFDQNFSLLVAAATTGQQIQFWVSGNTVCNAAQVNWVEFGVEH
jgi:hypothetical protein